ncbi:MAG: alpha/beta hydrolase family protein [Verrucomicrobia bacterium]|nr:alpha/beta hydrolase family protein [Verrucomicrobiota bacterium]
MALVHCKFYSNTLGMSSSMDVILPQLSESQFGVVGRDPGRPHPCLFLLHGLSDDHTAWQRRTAIERYAAPLGLAVVMPNVHRSFYTNMAAGPNYWTFISEEVPAIARELFHLSTRREDTFVAGLSMGGYGAFKLALRCPGNYAAAASLSGALDVAGHIPEPDMAREIERERSLIFGDGDLAGTENDLLACASALAASKAPCPRLYQWCGTEDFLYADNLRFRDHAQSLALPLTYEDGPGDHEWGVWDIQIKRVLDWLPIQTS